MRLFPALASIATISSLAITGVAVAQMNQAVTPDSTNDSIIEVPEIPSSNSSSVRYNPGKKLFAPGQLDNLGLCRQQVAKLQTKVKQLSNSVSSLSRQVADVQPGRTRCVGNFSVTTTDTGGIESIQDCTNNGYACNGVTGACFDSCNNSTWCAPGYLCNSLPRPGHCASGTPNQCDD